MRLTADLVRDTYRNLLGREPESEEVVQEHCTKYPEYFDFLSMVQGSLEYRLTHTNIDYHHDYRGYKSSDLNLLVKYEDVSRKKVKGCIVNYFGAITDKSFLPKAVQAFPDTVEGIPVPMNFIAEAGEHLGVIESIENSSGKFICFELGAGFGPWTCVCGVICRRMNRPFYLVAVEGDQKKIKFIEKNYEQNGISSPNYEIFNAVVGNDNKELDFPVLQDPSQDYGSSINRQKLKGITNIIGYRKTAQLTIEKLLSNFERVNLVHIDIQGSEFAAIKQSINALNKQVEYLVIGTHSRKIEGDLFDLLWNEQWKLVREKPCLFKKDRNLDAVVDGIQVWRNLR